MIALTGSHEVPSFALSVANLTVTRRGDDGARVTVLDDVSLALGRGECLAIVGASGSGKSVLARTLLGLTDPTVGRDPAGTGWQVAARRLEITDHDMRGASQRAWRKVRGTEIALVLQDALQSLDPLRTIEAEVGEALALQSGSVGRTRGARRSAVIHSLEAAGLSDARELLPLRADALSGGMRQRALIASALIGGPQVLVADEPTTALDPATARQVLDEFARVRDSGASLIIVSHDLGAVARIADRIAVLDGGRIVEVGTADKLLTDPAHDVTRGLVAAIPREQTSAPAAGTPDSSSTVSTDVLASFRGATRSFGTRAGKYLGVRDITLEVRRGEVLGVAGGSGEGKTTLARILAGAERLDSGSLTLADGARVRLIPQDPLATFDPRWRVQRILDATIERAARRQSVDGATGAGQEKPSAASLMRRVGLSPKLLKRKPATLSGGERQRVAIARALAARPNILVADEAVSALDTVTQAGILQLLRSLRDELAIVFVSHDLGMLASLSDRIVVVREGQIVDQAETQAFLGAALGR